MWPIFIMGEERERRRERARRRESTLQDHVIYNKMRIALWLPENFPVCWPPGPSSLGFSRESLAEDIWCYVAFVYHGEMFSFIGNQRVGIFSPKSKILFYLALIWCQNFLDWTIPVGGDTWTSLKKGNSFPSWGISEWGFYHQNQKFSSPWEYLSFDIKKSRVCLLL